MNRVIELHSLDAGRWFKSAAVRSGLGFSRVRTHELGSVCTFFSNTWEHQIHSHSFRFQWGSIDTYIYSIQLNYMFLWNSNWLQAFVKKASFDVWFSSTPNRWRRLQRWVVPIRSMVPITCHQYLGEKSEREHVVVPQSLRVSYIFDLIAAAVSGFYIVGASLGEVRSRWDGVAGNLSLGSVLHSSWVMFPDFVGAVQYLSEVPSRTV